MADVKELVGAVKGFGEDLVFAANSIKQRGVRHYQRALVIAALCVVASYKYVYQSGAAKLQRMEAGLGTAKATSQYADTYLGLEEGMRIFTGRLAPAGRPQEWLLETVRDSMKQEGIVSMSLSPVATNEIGDFKVISLTISCQASYRVLGSWLARMEGSPQLMHISSLSVRKSSERIGENDVTVTISSLLAKGARL